MITRFLLYVEAEFAAFFALDDGRTPRSVLFGHGAPATLGASSGGGPACQSQPHQKHYLACGVRTTLWQLGQRLIRTMMASSDSTRRQTRRRNASGPSASAASTSGSPISPQRSLSIRAMVGEEDAAAFIRPRIAVPTRLEVRHESLVMVPNIAGHLGFVIVLHDHSRPRTRSTTQQPPGEPSGRTHLSGRSRASRRSLGREATLGRAAPPLTSPLPPACHRMDRLPGPFATTAPCLGSLSPSVGLSRPNRMSEFPANPPARLQGRRQDGQAGVGTYAHVAMLLGRLSQGSTGYRVASFASVARVGFVLAM